MNSVCLTARIVQSLREVGLRASRPQLENLALLCQALAYSPDCHLANLALHVPLAARRASVTQRLQRCLKNEHWAGASSYAPVMQHLLRTWTGSELCLVLDRTDLAADLSILLLGLAYHKRTLPLTWQVLRFGGTGAAEQLPLLQCVQPYLPADVPVCLLADNEFRSLEVQAWCRQHDWHWQVGVRCELNFRTANSDWRPLRSLGLAPGERRYIQAAYLGAKEAFGPVNLIADWAPKQSGPRYWALDQPANAQAWRHGRKRYWIEPTFRDWKSAGFDLEASQLRDPQRLERLLLAMALTSLWLSHIGEWLQRSGRSAEFARRATDYSRLRLARDYLQRCQLVGGQVPVGFDVAGWA
jgi:hypothetical protein